MLAASQSQAGSIAKRETSASGQGRECARLLRETLVEVDDINLRLSDQLKRSLGRSGGQYQLGDCFSDIDCRYHGLIEHALDPIRSGLAMDESEKRRGIEQI